MTDNYSGLSDDVLVAYADNELSEDEMLRLAPLIAADAEAAGKVDNFRRSGEQLRDFFSVDVSEVTQPDIAAKIRAMRGGNDTVDNIVSLQTYRQRLTRGFRTLSSGAGLQKIAASLIVGVFVGIGATAQFGEYGQSSENSTSQIKLRGAPAQPEHAAGSLLLQSGGLTFVPGSIISKTKRYRIAISTGEAEVVSLKFYEEAKAPETLIDRKSAGALKTMAFPDSLVEGVKIDTEAPFVTFEVILQTKGRTIRKFSVFGIE